MVFSGLQVPFPGHNYYLYWWFSHWFMYHIYSSCYITVVSTIASCWIGYVYHHASSGFHYTSHYLKFYVSLVAKWLFCINDFLSMLASGWVCACFCVSLYIPVCLWRVFDCAWTFLVCWVSVLVYACVGVCLPACVFASLCIFLYVYIVCLPVCLRELRVTT
jgi:hypothetical protein